MPYPKAPRSRCRSRTPSTATGATRPTTSRATTGTSTSRSRRSGRASEARADRPRLAMQGPALGPGPLGVEGEADRAAHSGAADAAITGGVLRQVLLVVVLGVEERRVLHGADLGGDVAVAGRGEHRLVALEAGL